MSIHGHGSEHITRIIPSHHCWEKVRKTIGLFMHLFLLFSMEEGTALSKAIEQKKKIPFNRQEVQCWISA